MFNFILPKFLFKIEKWKWNPEYRVYVSNMGHFKNEHKQDLPIRIDSKKGYCTILTNCGFILAHRLVMFTWKPIPNAEILTVDHLDHNKRNNSVENLEWVTREENWARSRVDLVNCGADEKTPVAVKVTPSTQPRYKAGKKLIFNTLDEAAAWCIQQPGTTQLTLEQAKAKILIKCKSGAKYYGRTWKEVY